MPIPTGEIAPKYKPDAIQVFILVALVFVFITGGFIYRMIGNVSEDHRHVLATLAMNRATLCDIQYSLGITMAQDCDSSEIQRYRNPETEQGSSASVRNTKDTRLLLCQVMLRAYPEKSPECLAVLEGKR